jgi:hypothetical protein
LDRAPTAERAVKGTEEKGTFMDGDRASPGYNPWHRIERFCRARFRRFQLAWKEAASAIWRLTQNYIRWTYRFGRHCGDSHQAGVPVPEKNRVRENHLLNMMINFAPEYLRDDTARSFVLSIGIIKHYFGEEWLTRHVSPENPTPGFLRTYVGRDERAQLSLFKIVDFAELLFNLQDIEGFDYCIEQMRQGNIEGTYAELDFGRMLRASNIEFRFVIRRGVKGSDYDIEITLSDGLKLCADAKCKIETTEFSEETIRNTLKRAVDQLPKNRPGIIFLKVPSSWFNKLPEARELITVGQRFLRGSTKRVVSIKFFMTHQVWRDGMLTQSHGFKEISNPNNRFDPNRNWDMFAEPNPNPSWNGMPKDWRRLVFFPKDGPDG